MQYALPVEEINENNYLFKKKKQKKKRKTKNPIFSVKYTNLPPCENIVVFKIIVGSAPKFCFSYKSKTVHAAIKLEHDQTTATKLCMIIEMVGVLSFVLKVLMWNTQ